MFVILATLLVILGITGWIVFNDEDEVHSIAASIAGVIAIIWFFILVSLPVKLLLMGSILVIYKRLHIAHK